jgi:N-methylhydantoinase A
VLLELFAAMEREGDAWLAREGVAASGRSFRRVLDARYRGQNFEVKVDCAGLGAGDLHEVTERFHAAHTREYGYAIRDRGIEFVSARVQAVGAVKQAPHARIVGGASLDAARIGRRPVFVDIATGWMDADVYAREALPIGVPFVGPAVVNEMSATTLLLPGQTATVDVFGNVVVEIGA